MCLHFSCVSRRTKIFSGSAHLSNRGIRSCYSSRIYERDDITIRRRFLRISFSFSHPPRLGVSLIREDEKQRLLERRTLECRESGETVLEFIQRRRVRLARVYPGEYSPIADARANEFIPSDLDSGSVDYPLLATTRAVDERIYEPFYRGIFPRLSASVSISDDRSE